MADLGTLRAYIEGVDAYARKPWVGLVHPDRLLELARRCRPLLDAVEERDRLKAALDEAWALADQLAEAIVAADHPPTVAEADALLAWDKRSWREATT